MNYLAHIFLAAPREQAMLGALLGDFVKPSASARYSDEIEAEILMHRRIDAYTDSHAAVREAKDRFRPETRRYAGILLDVFYDHLLIKDWNRYSVTPIDEFIARFYATLQSHRSLLPPKLAGMAPAMIAQDWLGSYKDFAGVEHAACRISGRLSKNGQHLREGLQDLRDNRAFFAEGFRAFFSQLIAFVEEKRSRNDSAGVRPKPLTGAKGPRYFASAG